jgi:hypothetical protein
MSAVAARVLNDVARIIANIERAVDRLILYAGDPPIPADLVDRVGSRPSRTVASLARWGEKGAALGWTEQDLFGLDEPPAKPHPSNRRLSCRGCIGLVWLLLAPIAAKLC